MPLIVTFRHKVRAACLIRLCYRIPYSFLLLFSVSFYAMAQHVPVAVVVRTGREPVACEGAFKHLHCAYCLYRCATPDKTVDTHRPFILVH